jgi:hypothetical protein
MVQEQARRDSRPAGRRASSGLAVALWALIPVILFLTYWTQLFESFSMVGCEGVCDLDLSLGARAAYPWGVGASVLIAIAVAVVMRVRRKPPQWAPLLGLVLVLVTAIGTSIMFQIGLGPMYERNDRAARGEAPIEPSLPLPDPVGTWEAGADGATSLQLSPDGTVTGNDGCNVLSGSWTQDSEGEISLDLLTEATKTCDGADAWLGRGRSADIVEGYMYVNGEAGSAIGGLQPAR